MVREHAHVYYSNYDRPRYGTQTRATTVSREACLIVLLAQFFGLFCLAVCSPSVQLKAIPDIGREVKKKREPFAISFSNCNLPLIVKTLIIRIRFTFGLKIILQS